MLFKLHDWTSAEFPCEILDPISGGYMAELYIARLKNTAHLVTVKAVGKERKEQMLLEKEVECLQKMRWEGVPEVYGYFQDEDRSYYVMSYHKGMNLERHIMEYGLLEEKMVQKVILKLCGILAYMHSDRIAMVHNDIKPANILLQEDGEVTLLDYGLAESVGEMKHNVEFHGTLGYAAPENWHREKFQITPAGDIFSLGVTLFYLLEGKEPRRFYGRFSLTKEEKKNRWQSVLDRCCALDVRKRYQSAAQVYEVISKIKV
jgi:serine/threonine-protein kinase